MLRTLLNLDGDIRVKLKILCKPHGTEVAPTKFLNNNIPVEEDFTHVHWVVPADLIIRHAFVLATVLIVEERIMYYVFQRGKVQLSVVLLLEILHGILLGI
jgi:hypothetical protein